MRAYIEFGDGTSAVCLSQEGCLRRSCVQGSVCRAARPRSLVGYLAIIDLLRIYLSTTSGTRLLGIGNNLTVEVDSRFTRRYDIAEQCEMATAEEPFPWILRDGGDLTGLELSVAPAKPEVILFTAWVAEAQNLCIRHLIPGPWQPGREQPHI